MFHKTIQRSLDASYEQVEINFEKQSIDLVLHRTVSSTYSYGRVEAWLKNQTWTEESKVGWQEFYNNASRYLGYGRSH